MKKEKTRTRRAKGKYFDVNSKRESAKITEFVQLEKMGGLDFAREVDIGRIVIEPVIFGK